MNKIHCTILLIFIIIITGLIIYRYNSDKKSQMEQFTALSGFEPLTSYDDYGTFNFILHINDLPYYDAKGFGSIFCGKPDYVPTKTKLRGSVNPTAPNSDLKVDFDFDSDSFINYQGFKVRRELIPSNYATRTDKYDRSGRSGRSEYSVADFGSDRAHWLIKKNRPRASSQPPEPLNYYFSPRHEKYEPLF